VSRETLQFDVVVVGAGPAGLAAACRLGQLAQSDGVSPSVCVVEKGAEVGAHILSGAVLEPRALAELFPDWRERGAPLATSATADRMLWLPNARRALEVPSLFVPRPMRNHGNYIVSLGNVCRWLGAQAEQLGCHVLPATAATEVLYEGQHVAGVITGDFGVARDGTRKPNYQPGYELRAKYVIFAEGCRGHLGKMLEARFALRAADCDPQHYGIGFKEVWQVTPAQHRAGEVVHTVGWPLDDATDGGGFLYHAADHQVFVGLVVSLSYRNPYLDPFEEFQRWKQHPRIRAILAGGERIAYGARAVNKGGYYSLPRLVVPGGLLVGCDAGFLNPAKIKGSHTAMKTGMLAAECVHGALASGDAGGRELEDFRRRVRESWVHTELEQARNFGGALARFGTRLGGAFAFVEHNVLRGRSPFTLRNRVPDHATLMTAAGSAPITYSSADGVVSFDKLSSVFLSNTAHVEDQPCHLRLADAAVPIAKNLPLFAEPAQRYCPAAVYEVLEPTGAPQFRINAANCVHCKTCDIKDPAQNITWVPPEGGGGPNYVGT
jgi:electron-transferring-flavoprotein dehydrogenase